MKLKLLIVLTLIATTAYYIYQDPALNKKFMGKIHQVAPELNNSTLYKWQNSKGEWQITDVPPAKGIAFTTVKSQDQVNVMPASKTEKKR